MKELKQVTLLISKKLIVNRMISVLVMRHTYLTLLWGEIVSKFEFHAHYNYLQ